MKISKVGIQIIDAPEKNAAYAVIERAGRICHKLEHLSKDETTATGMVIKLIKRGHESVLEHQSVSLILTVDRGITHEVVRHRLASFTQESTRYAHYGKDRFGNECTFILPFMIEDKPVLVGLWTVAMKTCETIYLAMLASGCTPEVARSVLPNSLKADIMVTANFREWRWILKLRTAEAAHPQMREVMNMVRDFMGNKYPEVFGEFLPKEEEPVVVE